MCFCTVSDNLDHQAHTVWAHMAPILKKSAKVGHGKGPLDGVGEALKRGADKKVAHGADITKSSEFVAAMADSSIILFEINSKEIYRFKREVAQSNIPAIDEIMKDLVLQHQEHLKIVLQILLQPLVFQYPVFSQKVSFAVGDSLTTIHLMIAWDYAYRAARIGPWEQIARDRTRFQARINQMEDILKPVEEEGKKTEKPSDPGYSSTQNSLFPLHQSPLFVYAPNTPDPHLLLALSSGINITGTSQTSLNKTHPTKRPHLNNSNAPTSRSIAEELLKHFLDGISPLPLSKLIQLKMGGPNFQDYMVFGDLIVIVITNIGNDDREFESRKKKVYFKSILEDGKCREVVHSVGGWFEPPNPDYGLVIDQGGAKVK
uniref:Uncharacterized protein n=1 Tax=Timema bartmani TaxID=61472 RepID=A0A7R9I166_9NEOP|nr:unnamed protein product [Timema bartmani]